MASGDQVKALVRSHADGDDSAFYAMAMQVAARAARQGFTTLAGELKQVVDQARNQGPSPRPDRGDGQAGVTSIAHPRGELADLVTIRRPQVGLRDLVVSEEVRLAVRQVLDEQRNHRTLEEHGFAPVHRLLLEGPPGTGKTMTAAVLAHELALPLLSIRLDAVISKFMGDTARKLRTVFDAIEASRAVYLFDEFDALGGDRSAQDVGEARRILNAFLVFLEEASPRSMVVAATNHQAILDRALFRRFDLVIHYALPDPSEGRAVMRARLGALGRGLHWEDLPDPANLSHADLVRVAETAAKAALLEGHRKVTARDLRRALAHAPTRPAGDPTEPQGELPMGLLSRGRAGHTVPADGPRADQLAVEAEIGRSVRPNRP